MRIGVLATLSKLLVRAVARYRPLLPKSLTVQSRCSSHEYASWLGPSCVIHQDRTKDTGSPRKIPIVRCVHRKAHLTRLLDEAPIQCLGDHMFNCLKSVTTLKVSPDERE